MPTRVTIPPIRAFLLLWIYFHIEFTKRNTGHLRTKRKEQMQNVSALSSGGNIGRAVYPASQVPFRVCREPFRPQYSSQHIMLYLFILYRIFRFCQLFTGINRPFSKRCCNVPPLIG